MKSNGEQDAGQSFIPYFDATEVGFNSAAPISSIALIHYTNDAKYAGFIRPSIRSLNYKKFILQNST